MNLKLVVVEIRAVAFVWLAAELAHGLVCEDNWLIGTDCELPQFAG